MSTYVMSDLHGCKTEFDEMLKQIEFNEYDTLWIVGDICDRGNESIPLLQEIMSHENMHITMGNHDVWLAKYCQELIDAKKDTNSVTMTDDLLCWLHYNGGYPTADQFMDLETPDCYDIKLYLEDVPLYQFLEVKGKKFLLVHAGVDQTVTSDPKSISKLPEQILVWAHIGIDENPWAGQVTMVVGHTPTFLYGDEYEGKILHGKDDSILHLDCGCVFGRTLGCLRLDDMQEFYVKSTYPYIENDNKCDC